MASRKIEDLHPKLQPLAQRFVENCRAAGVEVLITCTFRSNAEQAQLYAQGRTLPGKIITNAKPGQSKHNNTIENRAASLAFDIVPMVDGKPQWDAKHPAWQVCGRIGRALGLEWAGDWVRFKEYPHFQLPDGLQQG